MTDETSPRAGTTVTEPPASPYDTAPPAWTPTAPPLLPPADGAATPSLRDRVVKLWLALAVGAACLVAGLGLGAAIGHATAGSGSDGVVQPPGIGPGQGAGQGFGRGFDGQGPDGQGPDREGLDRQGFGGQAPDSESDSESESDSDSGTRSDSQAAPQPGTGTAS
jgi:hypothetical protein